MNKPHDVVEDIAVAYEEPVIDKDGAIVLEKGQPVTEIVWRRPDGEEVTVPKKLLPENVQSGMHVHLGPPKLIPHKP